MTQAAIARAAGISPSALSQLLTGKTKLIHVRHAQAILGVEIDNPAEGARVPVRLVRPLIENMLASGLSHAQLCRIFRLKRRDVPYLRYASVEWRTYQRVVTLYRLLVRAGRVPVLLDIEEAS
jgi:transcriptional regulator with XRE-family HTH domain